MPEAPHSRYHERLMQGALAGTAILFLMTLVPNWQFNLSHDGFWFLRSGAFLLLALALVWRQCLHIKTTWLRVSVAILAVEVLAIFVVGRLVSFYYQGESFNEEFFFHFNWQTFTFGLTSFPGLMLATLAYLVVAGVLAFFSVYWAHTLELENRTFLIVPGLILALVLDPDIFRYLTTSVRDANARDGLALSTIDWEGTGLKREALYKMSDDIVAGKNVVMIYMESVEKMYTDETLFPGLTPFLNSLQGEALAFENLVQTRGTNFTVAGILSSHCGTPLLFPNGPGGNDILKNGFLQEGVCVGDLLDAAGYRQVFMGGASHRFAGKGVFLEAHGYDEIHGLEDLQPQLDDPAYTNNWGLYDDSLLQLAAERFDRLVAESDAPFNFTVLTVDTHPPDGTVSASCEPYDYIDNNILHAVHCTDQLVEKFVNHLKQSPAWDDTVVMLMSDHLHMRNTAMAYYPPDYERKLFVNILNAGVTGKIDRRGTHMDIAPTLLNLMGVQHGQVFLAGDDLLAPLSSPPLVDPDDFRRIAAIRYINTNLLSRLETGLCEADPLYSFDANTLRVAGREIDLSMRGRPLPLSTLGTNHALLTLVSNEGRVGLTFPVVLRNLAYVLYQFRENSFLLMTPSAPVKKLYPDLADYDNLGVLFGNVNGDFDVLARDLTLQQGFTVQAECDDLLAKSRELETENIEQSLGRICNNTAPDGTTWREEAGVITLESVGYGNQRFKADLQRDNHGWYSVTSLNQLPDEPEPGACDAYYGSGEILIPGIHTDDGPASMVLEKIPGVTLTFELGPVAPLPNE